MSVLGSVPFSLYRHVRHAGTGFISSSFTGSYTVAMTDEDVLVLNPLNGNRNVVFMSASLVTAQSRIVMNSGNSGSLAVIDPVASTTVSTIPPQSGSIFMSNGTTWARIV